ncbi:MAG: hypothetical protein JO280_08285 [Mycobacteriaceae bacterium]|nr:hypothetical protein [Mycobacteriaceae bacterium]
MASNTRSTSTRKGASTSHRTSNRIQRVDRMSVNLPMVGRVQLPRPEHLAYYGGLGVLAALQLLEWPLALVLGVGHALAENHHSRVAQELGEALDEA